MCIAVEWAARKAASNAWKHGVEFDEAVTCLLDPRALVVEDVAADGEARWVLVGMSARARLLTVVHTMRDGRIRIISARKVTRREARAYA